MYHCNLSLVHINLHVFVIGKMSAQPLLGKRKYGSGETMKEILRKHRVLFSGEKGKPIA